MKRNLDTPRGDNAQTDIEAREAGLSRSVNVRQMAMIAIGSSIGTGLFLGSGIAVGYAGPGVLISYVVAAFVAMVVMISLTEMTIAHASAGSFGAQAEYYVGAFAGYATRYTYWAIQVIAIGGEATAIALYMKLWYPHVPGAVWVVIAALGLLGLNLSNVKNFGWAEYGFTAIKITAIVGFILLGLYVIARGYGGVDLFTNLYTHGGFLPHGWGGVWMAVLMAIFSFYGIEVVAITAGETREPKKNIPRAFRLQFVRLVIFYFGSLIVMLSITPWNKTGAIDVSQSPFILSLQALHLPYATGILNFVVIVAAISSMNSDLYVCARMLFSLSRSGMAMPAFGRLTKKSKVPANAVLASSCGMAIALILNLLTPSAFNILFGLSIFGGLLVWIMILVTFIAYRRREGTAHVTVFRAPWSPWLQLCGIAILGAVLLTMLFSATWRFSWYAGVPFIVLLFVAFTFFRRNNAHRSAVSNDSFGK